MRSANDSAASRLGRRLCRREPSLSDRIRLALIFVTILSCVAARAGGALGAVVRSTHSTHVSRATRLAREQASIVRYARHLLGVRYVYGGTSPRTGFDCSGFTRFVYAHFGVSLPHYSGAQFNMGRRVSRVGLRPGDLLFFNGLGHVGMYVGNGRFIHAPHTGASVEIDSLNSSYGASFDGARRFV
jgi:cell wall-associated NlpC family hydrolase